MSVTLLNTFIVQPSSPESFYFLTIFQSLSYMTSSAQPAPDDIMLPNTLSNNPDSVAGTALYHHIVVLPLTHVFKDFLHYATILIRIHCILNQVKAIYETMVIIDI